MSMLVAGGGVYRLWEPPDEDVAFRSIVEQHVNDIFGVPSFAFNLEHTIKTPVGRGGIPDDFVLSLKPAKLWIVENELAKHDVYQHIVPQLGKFMRAIRNPETQLDLIDALDEAIRSKPNIEMQIKAVITPKDLHKFISEVVRGHADFAIVIDEATAELEDVYENLPTRPKLVVLKTYVKNPTNLLDHICVFEPLAATVPSPPRQLRITVTPSGVQQPATPRVTWTDRLAKAKPNNLTLLEQFKARLNSEFGTISEKTSGDDLLIASGEPFDWQRRFCAILLREDFFRVRIAVDQSFKDPYNITTLYKSWFFRPAEAGFPVKSEDDLPRAMELTRYSYNLALVRAKVATQKI